MTNLGITHRQVETWHVPVAEFSDAARSLSFGVKAIIGNSVPTSATGKMRLAEWKIAVAVAAKAERGDVKWRPS